MILITTMVLGMRDVKHAQDIDEGDADLAEDDLVDRGNQIKQSMLGIESSTAG